MDTRIARDYRKQWTAKTIVPLEGKQELHISTSKDDRGRLRTYASVGVREGCGWTHAVFADFSKMYAQDVTRCTQANVRAQHISVLAKLDAIKADIALHYAKSEAA